MGTRFKPWTDKHPKALAVINGKSLLQRNVEYLQRFGITEIVVNVHHFADQIEQAISDSRGWGSEIRVSDERDEVLETGGGLKKARPYLEGSTFVVLNVDILTDLDLRTMIDSHEQQQPLATLAVTDRTTSRYFLFDEQQLLSGWRNTKTGEEKISRAGNDLQPKAFSGIHVINPDIFNLLTREGKFSIVDTYLELAKFYTIRAFDHSGGKLIDVGKPEAVATAEASFV